MEKSIYEMTLNELYDLLKEYKETRFYLDCKDRWNSEDYENDSKLLSAIKEIQNLIANKGVEVVI